MQIIGITVAIIINFITGHFFGIYPQNFLQVFMGRINAIIQNGNNNGRTF